MHLFFFVFWAIQFKSIVFKPYPENLGFYKIHTYTDALKIKKNQDYYY